LVTNDQGAVFGGQQFLDVDLHLAMVWHQAFRRLLHSLAIIHMLMKECCCLFLLFVNLGDQLLGQVLVWQLWNRHLTELVDLLLRGVRRRLQRVVRQESALERLTAL
jgi:hypothetical protein